MPRPVGSLDRWLNLKDTLRLLHVSLVLGFKAKQPLQVGVNLLDEVVSIHSTTRRTLTTLQFVDRSRQPFDGTFLHAHPELQGTRAVDEPFGPEKTGFFPSLLGTRHTLDDSG